MLLHPSKPSYLNRRKGNDVSNMQKLLNVFTIYISLNSAIWKYLHHISSLLENVAKALSLVPKDERETIRHELTAASRRRNSFSAHSPQYTGSRLPRSTSVGIPDVTGKSVSST